MFGKRAIEVLERVIERQQELISELTDKLMSTDYLQLQQGKAVGLLNDSYDKVREEADEVYEDHIGEIV